MIINSISFILILTIIYFKNNLRLTGIEIFCMPNLDNLNFLISNISTGLQMIFVNFNVRVNDGLAWSDWFHSDKTSNREYASCGNLIDNLN